MFSLYFYNSVKSSKLKSSSSGMRLRRWRLTCRPWWRIWILTTWRFILLSFTLEISSSNQEEESVCNSPVVSVLLLCRGGNHESLCWFSSFCSVQLKTRSHWLSLLWTLSPKETFRADSDWPQVRSSFSLLLLVTALIFTSLLTALYN